MTQAHRISSLSLYDGDLINHWFARLRLGPRKPQHLLGRAVLLTAIAWFPMACLAIYEGLYSARVDARNFFADFAAYAVFFVGLPLFIVAEAIVSRATSEAGIEFAHSGVLKRPRKLLALGQLHQQVERLKNLWQADLACLAIAYLQSGAIILSELYAHGPVETWHTNKVGDQWDVTATGLWAFGIALPLAIYWWVRHAWRILIWCRYLYGVSRLRLDLVATHPDRTGGIGFVSEAQTHFAWMIFAYGFTNVAAPVGYQLAVLQVDFATLPVWGSIAGFIVGAPLLFTLPLFFFTRQLSVAKLLARRRYRKLLTAHARWVENKVLNKPVRRQETAPAAVDVTLMSQLSQLYERVQGMRVVPFDFRSMVQLITSTLGSVVGILPMLRLEGPATRALEILVKILDRLPFGH